MSAILECKKLTKKYGKITALEDVNLSLPKGKIVGLLGPNGSGKSTIMKLAAGLLQPSSGEIRIKGMKPGLETKKIVSYLPEHTSFSNWMTVKDTLNLFQDFYEDFDMTKAKEMLKDLDIGIGQNLETMTTGEKDKLQLILALCRKAKLYLLDEPIAALDPATRNYILNAMISNYREDATIVISTHSISDIERVLDEFIFIGRQKILMQIETEMLREEQGISVDQLFREVFKC